eukprot:2777072-Heterocapsa_arctica.AAC.1
MHAHAHGNWEQVSKSCYFAQLLRPLSICVKGPGGDTWYFSLGDVGGVVGLGWPAQATYTGDSLTALRPDMAGMPTWLVVHDPLQWKAITYDWHGPWQQKHGKLPMGGMESGGLLAVPRAQPQPLMKEAAAMAFWNLALQPLMWILN